MTMKPLHIIEVDSARYCIRRDYYGRYQGYRMKPEGLEQSMGRMQGYVSVKEVWDMIFERTIQPDAYSVGAALDLVRAQYNVSDDPVEAGRAREALEKEGVPL